MIDVANGLANGTVGKLSYVELNTQNEVLRVWLLFPKGVGVKARGKELATRTQKESVQN